MIELRSTSPSAIVRAFVWTGRPAVAVVVTKLPVHAARDLFFLQFLDFAGINLFVKDL